MSTAAQRKQKFIRYFRQQTGTSEVNMHEVAQMAHKMCWSLPKPVDPMDLFAKQFADAAREETREDKVTRRSYKANLAYLRRTAGGKQLWLWFDVDEATRPQMVKGLHHYREQMVGEAVIGVNTANHWNRVNPAQQKLGFIADLSPDVEEREMAANLEEEKAG
ncbi:MAG: hypothetical protein ACRD2B_05125 [Terriglobia bacterium]